uniref:ATP synthase subunit a n=1 Tax=Pseudocrangonyx daejeonensis TaxID=2038767 RepID=A0A346SAF8_9CRUS|nr:ATP synthase F0 subunit 6 [Pseudocrangonyx daejeonensis]AXT17546.1 ATP synthase F0 subunit 6 [Pseudocrangonyx daejeonensis]
MMTNLFSIFDPSTPYFASFNWFSMALVFLFNPMYYWTTVNRLTLLFKKSVLMLFMEFSLLLAKYPYLTLLPLSLFYLIMFNNVPGLLPYVFTATSHLSFTLSLALTMWLAITLFSMFNNTNNMLAHMIPMGTPPILMPFMVLIESVSLLIRPGTLAVRLAANMIAGHLLLELLSSATAFTPILWSPLLNMAQIALFMLELAVSFIQAYVFATLATLYLSEAK